MKLLPLIIVKSLLSTSLAQEIPCTTEPVRLNPGLESAVQFGENLNDEMNKSTPEELTEVALRLKNLKKCPEKIWPNYKLPETPLRFIDPSRDSVFKYDKEKEKFEWERTVTEKDKKVTSFEPNTDNDGGITVNGRRYLKPKPRPESESVPPQKKPPGPSYCIEENKAFDTHMMGNMGKSKLSSVDKMLSFAAHEAFHTVDQNPSSVVHQHGEACQWHREEFQRSLPGDIGELKVARQHLIVSLLAAYKAPKGSEERSQALAQVKAWNHILETKFPEESKLLDKVDRTEGMAEYAGIMANVHGKLGCSANEKDKKNMIIDHLDNRYMPSIQDPDQQGYLIGAVSGLLMDEEGVGDWKEQVMKTSTSPHNLLKEKEFLKSAKVVEAKKDDILLASIPIEKNLNDCKNAEVKKALDPILNGNEEYVLIQLDPVAFSSTGFNSYTSESGENYNVSLSSSSNGETVRIENQPIIRIDGLCPKKGGSANYVAVPKRLIDKEGNITPQEKHKVTTKIDLADQSVKWNSHLVDCR